MNFDDAITAHIKWKIDLGRFINGGTTGKLDSATASKDNLCELGRWIYGEGAKYKAFASYKNLVMQHADFHKTAAEVLKKVEAGDKKGAKSLLSGEFSITSKDTVTAILQLKNDAVEQPSWTSYLRFKSR